MNAIALSAVAADAQEAVDPDAAYYAAHGYVIVRNLIPKQQIQDLLATYSRLIVPSRYPFFRQSSNAYEPNQISTHGYVRQSFLDIHDYTQFPEFSDAARDLFCSPSMRTALSRISGFAAHSLMQTMLFDLNTATPGH